MLRHLSIIAAIAISALIAPNHAQAQQETEKAKVYFTSDISPESLVKIYHVLGKEATGKVAVKISTGESAQSNQLRPELIGQLVQTVNGTLVECNTAYSGNRSNTASHRRAIEQRGYNEIASVDIMDEDGYIDIPVSDAKYLKFDRVGSHLANYDFLINLAHFKGHGYGRIWWSSEEPKYRYSFSGRQNTHSYSRCVRQSTLCVSTTLRAGCFS